MCILCNGYFVAHLGTAFIIRLLWKQFLMLDENEIIVGSGALWRWCERREIVCRFLLKMLTFEFFFIDL